MKSETVTRLIWSILLVLVWVIFVGLCIKAGAFIVHTAFAWAPSAVVARLWHEVDLSDLLRHDRGQYFTLFLIMSIVAVLQAWVFYLIVRMLHRRSLNIMRPFRPDVRRFIFQLSYLSLLIGFFSRYGTGYAAWLTGQGVRLPDTEALRLGGADVWLFMAVILFVIAQIFKRGIEIQTENELTV